MKRNIAIAVLSGLLLLAVGYGAYITAGHEVGAYNARITTSSQAGMLDAYDSLLCDLVCKKTIAEANTILGPDRIQASKKKVLGVLVMDGFRADVCLDGDVITAIDSSHSVSNWPKCLSDAFFAED